MELSVTLVTLKWPRANGAHAVREREEIERERKRLFQSADLAVTRANWHLAHNKDIYEPARFNYEKQKEQGEREK